MTAIQPSPRHNRLLAALTGEAYLQLLLDLELVEVKLGDSLHPPGEQAAYVYFPTTAVVALYSTTRSGEAAGVALIGNEGVVGLSLDLLLGLQTGHQEPRVIVAGQAYRLPAEVMRGSMGQAGELQRLVLCHTLAVMAQIAQTAVCNRHHSVDQQLSRWLLSILDRMPGYEINLTQAHLAGLIGVRREAVTEAAGRLQAAGLIRYGRGRITVPERSALDRGTCECHGQISYHYASLYLHRPATAQVERQSSDPLGDMSSVQAHQVPRAGGTAEMLAQGESEARESKQRQFALELHNEDLQRSYAEVETLRARFADLYDFAPVAHVSVDALGAITQINLAGAILLGIRHSEMARHRFPNCVRPEDRPAFKRFLMAVLAGAGARLGCELALLANDQRGPALVAIEAVSDEDGRECRMVVSDITARKQAEAALQAGRSRLRLILDTASEGICGADRDGLCTFINAAGLRMLGYRSEADLIGRPIHDLIHHTRPGGSSVPVESWSRPMLQDGEQVGVVVTFIDGSERRAAVAKPDAYRVKPPMFHSELQMPN